MYPTEACLSYDKVFRALKLHFIWMGDNTRLWNKMFSGRAVPKHCGHCNPTHGEGFQLSSEPSQVPPTLPISCKPHRRMGNCSWASIEPEALLCFCLCKATPLLPVPSITYSAPVPKSLGLLEREVLNPSQGARPFTQH